MQGPQPLDVRGESLHDIGMPAADLTVVLQFASRLGVDEDRQTRQGRRQVRHALLVALVALKPRCNVPHAGIGVDRSTNADATPVGASVL